MKLSVIIPVLNEEQGIPYLEERLREALGGKGFDYEIVIVDDGSTDSSIPLVMSWIERDPKVVLVELSRNFGHQAAITAGLTESTGDAVVILDSDLQDSPDLIIDMLEKWRQGYKVVVAERVSRKETGLRKVLMDLFYKTFQAVSDHSFKMNSGVFGLMDRQVVRNLLQLHEQNRFLPGLRGWIGFKTATISYERQARVKGSPRQSLGKLFKYGLDAAISFSYKPLRLSLFCGLFLSFGCFVYGAVLLVRRVMHIDVVPGFTTVAVAILFLGGVILISNGILGEYLARIYDEVKRRPLYIVSRTAARKEGGAIEIKERLPDD